MDFTPHTPADVAMMLDAVGLNDIDDLFSFFDLTPTMIFALLFCFYEVDLQRVKSFRL